MKVLSVVGARPQFIKAAPVSRALADAGYDEFLLHTGQHYDHGMSQVFFDELGLPEPDANLGIGSGPHGRQTGEMLAGIEEVLLAEKPDWVLVYGDTNSTLAGALAAAKLGIRLAHVEAGLRSFNWTMPEEINRVLTDRCSQALFCPTQTAVDNLAREGISDGVYLVGDVMVDALMQFLPRVDEAKVLAKHDLEAKAYVLATIHRAANTDSRDNLQAVLECLAVSPWPVIWPLHPRTAEALARYELEPPPNVRASEPVSYLEMLALEKNACFIMTDSGGVQKEAYILGVSCITLREETEWVETVAGGWNRVVGLEAEGVLSALRLGAPPDVRTSLFGSGAAAAKVVELLMNVAAEGIRFSNRATLSNGTRSALRESAARQIGDRVL